MTKLCRLFHLLIYALQDVTISIRNIMCSLTGFYRSPLPKIPHNKERICNWHVPWILFWWWGKSPVLQRIQVNCIQHHQMWYWSRIFKPSKMWRWVYNLLHILLKTYDEGIEFSLEISIWVCQNRVWSL